MLLATLTFSARDWFWPATATVLISFSLLAWSYLQGTGGRARWVCAGLKLLGICALAICLLEPLWSGQRARPGANLFAVVAYNRQGVQVKENG